MNLRKNLDTTQAIATGIMQYPYQMQGAQAA